MEVPMSCFQMVPIQVAGAPTIRAYPKMNPNREQQLKMQGPAVTVFVGMFIFLAQKCDIINVCAL